MATEKRLISPDAFWDNLDLAPSEWVKASTIKAILDETPTVDAVEVVHGRWIKNWCDNSFIGHEYAECSICDCHMLDTNQFWNSNYCPNCGAKMDGGNGDD